jgi:hypothetical protein
MQDQRLIGRLRASGLVPRFAAPGEGEDSLPFPLTSNPPAPQRQVGRRRFAISSTTTSYKREG